MFALIGATKLFSEVLAQPICLLLLWIGCRDVDTPNKHSIRCLAWAVFALFALLDILLLLSFLHFEGILAQSVMLAISLLMFRYEQKRLGQRQGREHLYVGRVFVAAGIGNFVLSHFTFLNGAATFVVALQSIILPLLMGMRISLPLIDTMGNSLLFKTQYSPNPLDGSFPQVRVLVPPTDIAVVYGCTGLREILFVFFAVAFTRADRGKKKRAFWIAATIIYAANILRNNLVIALYGGRWTSFEVAHSLLGNILIFLALTSAALVVFFSIPEVPESLFRILKQFKAFQKRAPSSFREKKIWPK